MTKNSNRSSSVFLFYGEDSFSAQRKIEYWKQEFARKFSAQAIVIINNQELNPGLIETLKQAVTPSLFSQKKLIIAKNILPSKAAHEQLAFDLAKIIDRVPEDTFLVFWQTEKLDQRLKAVKAILSLPLKQTKFDLPSGKMLNAWIKSEVGLQQGSIDEEVVETLAVHLGRDLAEEKKAGGRVVDRKEVFDLWQASNEIAKLINYNQRITKQSVFKLVAAKMPENVFAFTDQIIHSQEQQALQTLEMHMQGSNLDPKSEVIKILGLLTEQFKSLILVKSLALANQTNDQMAQTLGWSSGRVFVNLKLSKNVDNTKIKKLVALLLDIDLKLKTSDADPILLMNAFVHRACANA